MRANRGADGHKKREQGQRAIIAGARQISVEHGFAEYPQCAVLQVHEQESDIVEYVDGRERIVEFDAIEQDRHLIDQADIAEVEIPVAAPHIPVAGPRRKKILMSRKKRS